MPHPRTLIRETVIASLANATVAGARVFDTRVDPIRANEMPALAVYTMSEPVDPDSRDTAPREVTRELELEIKGWLPLYSGTSPGLAMDNLCSQIEVAMDANRFLGGAAAECILESTELDVLEHRDSPLIGHVVMTYAVTYRTSPAALTLDDFLRAKATHELVGGVPDTAPASDEFIVQETSP